MNRTMASEYVCVSISYPRDDAGDILFTIPSNGCHRIKMHPPEWCWNCFSDSSIPGKGATKVTLRNKGKCYKLQNAKVWKDLGTIPWKEFLGRFLERNVARLVLSIRILGDIMEDGLEKRTLVVERASKRLLCRNECKMVTSRLRPLAVATGKGHWSTLWR